MRIFITGANGQLAKSISGLYPKEDIYFGTRDKLDITNKKQVISEVVKFKPDIVFHFASLTRGDECARDPEKAFLINVEGTKNIIEACKKIDAAILFVSTNEVFDGKKRTYYTEKDTPNPITVAGKTKHEAEKVIRENLKRHFIVRTSWLYSKWSANFVHAVINKAKKDNAIQLVIDEVSSPTYSLDLAHAIKKLIKTKKYGLYHLVNRGRVSRHDFAKKAFDIHKIKKVKINPVKLSSYKRLSKPPLFSPLKNTKARNLGITLPKWDDALERFLKEEKI